jgi:serine/threonine protein kinase/tetratricopeptide (TPR) repeat protein
MGIVYEAEQLSLHRRVALKVLPFAGTLDPRQLQRFQNEAQAAACLHHTNIVPVYFVGCERGVHFYAMQFIDGQTLAELIRQLRQPAGPAPVSARLERTTAYAAAGGMAGPGAATEGDARQPTLAAAASAQGRDYFRRVAELGMQAAEALDHAHQAGIVHRDVKPANLLLDGRGNLWVTDFGLAHVQHSEASLTMTGDLVGTLRYMSPEQALAQRVVVDHRTDIYSLGVTLYELLTLQAAFAGSDRQELLRQIAFEEPRAPRRIVKAIPAELETVVLKAMAKNPADRYGTAQELADDLRRFLDDKPIRARRPSVGQWLRRWSRRHQALVRSTAAVVLLAAIGLAVSTVLIAKAYRKEAEKAAEADAVVKFLVDDLLGSVWPENARGRKVTVEEVLANAEKKIDGTLGGQPRVEAAIRITMGRTYVRLWRYPEAERYFQRARDLYTHLQGPQAPETLWAMHLLAESYRGLGRYADAVELNEKTLALKKVTLGPNHPDTLASMNNLARCYKELGRHAEALKLNEETLALRKATLGPDHPDTLLSMSNLATCYWELGQHATVLKLFEETLALRKATLGPDHPDTLSSMSNLASCYSRLGQQAAALKLFEEALALQKAKLGPDHPYTLTCMNNLASCYQELGQHAAALKLFEETLALTKVKLGPEHRQTLTCMHNLARCYIALGQHAAALKLFEETVALKKATLGPDHPDTLVSMNGLAWCYAHLGQHAAALKLNEETLPLQKAKLGPDHPDTLGCMNDLAAYYLELGQHAAALKLFEETLALRKAKLGPEHPHTLHSMGNLASCYAGLGQHAAALKLKEETLALMKAKLGPEHPDTLLAMFNLANGYQELGEHAAALKLFEETLALQKAKLGPEHPDTLNSMQNLASLLATASDVKLRDPPRAVELAKKVVALKPKQPGAWGALGSARYQTGDWKGASADLEKAIGLRRPDDRGPNADEGFFLAMAYWKMGEKDKARQCFARTAQEMDKSAQKETPRLKMIRAEAAELLGVGKKD